jgi:hypothetical protein
MNYNTVFLDLGKYYSVCDKVMENKRQPCHQCTIRAILAASDSNYLMIRIWPSGHLGLAQIQSPSQSHVTKGCGNVMTPALPVPRRVLRPCPKVHVSLWVHCLRFLQLGQFLLRTKGLELAPSWRAKPVFEQLPLPHHRPPPVPPKATRIYSEQHQIPRAIRKVRVHGHYVRVCTGLNKLRSESDTSAPRHSYAQ